MDDAEECILDSSRIDPTELEFRSVNESKLLAKKDMLSPVNNGVSALSSKKLEVGRAGNAVFASTSSGGGAAGGAGGAAAGVSDSRVL